MRILVGTSGWSYKEWKGSFYPADLPADDMLRYYGTRLPAVEINNSFYRIPKEKVLLEWAEQVPAAFRFVLKASRRITHINRLSAADDSLDYFLRTVNVLGDRLGPTLFQCPPSLKKDIARLREFLARVPRTWRAALEFRHASWFDDQIFARLRERNLALCFADSAERSTPIVPTASYGYFRLRDEGYTDADIDQWAETIRLHQDRWEETFVYFKHEEEGKGPDLAKRLMRRLDLPVVE